MISSLQASRAAGTLLAEMAKELPPLIKVKVYIALLFLLLVLLFLIVFNRLMARWARRRNESLRQHRRDSYSPDSDDWTRRPLIEEASEEEDS